MVISVPLDDKSGSTTAAAEDADAIFSNKSESKITVVMQLEGIVTVTVPYYSSVFTYHDCALVCAHTTQLLANTTVLEFKCSSMKQMTS